MFLVLSSYSVLFVAFFLPFARALVCPSELRFRAMHRRRISSAPLYRGPLSHEPRMHYEAHHKHNILTHYQAGVKGAGFEALARRFAIQGGGAVVKRWHDRWDGTPHSLQEKQRTGRPRVLSSRQVQQHVRASILRANRAHTSVHYPTVAALVRQRTGKDVSLPTLRRYGKKELEAKQKRGKKRTAEESQCIRTRESDCFCVLLMHDAHQVAVLPVHFQCLPICASRSPRCDASCSASVLATSSSSMRL